MYIDLVTINLCPGQGGGGVKPSGTLEISENGVYDVYSYSSASVDVPQSVTGFTEEDITEKNYDIINLDNSASFVASNAFRDNQTIQTVNLPYATSVGSDAFMGCFSLSQVNLPMCISIGSDAFMGCSSLSQVNLPVCSSIGGAAFMNCSNLTTVNLPMCNRIGSSAFMNCSSLPQVNLPMCSSIGSAAFRSCYSLSQVNLPMVKTIGLSTFGACRALTSLTLCTDVYWTIPFGARTYVGTPITNESGSGSIYVRSDTYSLWISSKLWSDYSSKFVSVPVSGPALSFSNGLLSGTTKAIASDFTSYLSVTTSDITGVSLPECRYIGEEAFAYCSTLNQVNLPECRYIYDYAFDNCESLSQISLPVCEYIGEVAFQRCSLKQVSLPKCSYIGNGAFLGCINLMSITIGYSSVCNMNVTDTDAFEGTYIDLGTGSIYVPASLVEAYKSAENWSKYSSQIFPIS